MKLQVALIAVACLVASSSKADIFSDDFTGDTPGSSPAGFTVVSPTTPTSTLAVIVTNVAGNNQANFLDNSGSAAARVEEDFTTTSAVHLSLSFTRNAQIAPSTTTQALYVSMGTNGLTGTAAANRTLDVRLYNDGTYRLDRGFQDGGGAFASNGVTSSGISFGETNLSFSAHTLDIYAYGAAVGGATLGYVGPDALTRILDPNSYAIYIDGALATPSASGLTANGDYGFFNSIFYGKGLGRFTIVSSATTITGVDFLIDNIHLTSIPAVPEPSTFVLLGVGGLFLVGALRRSRRSR